VNKGPRGPIDEHGRPQGGKKPPSPVVQRLPAAIVIYACPGTHGPAIVYLPVNGPHTAATVPPPVIHAGLNALHLQHLRDVNKGSKVLWVTVGFRKVVKDFSVSARVTLVGFHYRREKIKVFALCKALYCFQIRQGFKTEFRTITEKILPVFAEGLKPVPHFPVMHIPSVRIVGRVKAPARRRGRRPVKCLWICFFPNLRDH